MPTLSYEDQGRAATLTIPDSGVTIGRQVGNVLVLKDHNVSRFHAAIEFRRGLLGVRDLGSRNGTFVNGEKINDKGKRLKNGDTVSVGNTKLLIDASKENKNAKLENVGHKEMVAGTGLKDLAKLAGELPDRNVKPTDLQLHNSRGQRVLLSDEDKKSKADGPPSEAVTLLRLVLLVCFRTGASDVHLEPGSDGYVLRVRVDGTMTDLAKLTKAAGLKLATLIKVLSDIDMARNSQVQEGSFACKVPDRRVDYRVSFTPGLYGQKLVVRVLDTANAPQYLWDLGLGETEFETLDRLTRRNEGMILGLRPDG